MWKWGSECRTDCYPIHSQAGAGDKALAHRGFAKRFITVACRSSFAHRSAYSRRSLVGIEIPNKVVALVRLRNLIDNPAFTNSPPLTISLGRDVSGNPQYADIEKMPHLLIAGATGSGRAFAFILF